jgi:hypothetical protein
VCQPIPAENNGSVPNDVPNPRHENGAAPVQQHRHGACA